MSDLAPFVAAVLRDKTTSELLEENRKLRRALRLARSVEITSENGDTVYARGFIDRGEPAGNPNLWKVQLKPTRNACPLEDLGGLEVRVGGGIFHTSVSNDHEVLFDLDDEYDSDTSKAVMLCFPNGAGGLWLKFVVKKWPREGWMMGLLQEGEPENVRAFVESLAHEAPQGKTIKFVDVQFFRNQTISFLNRLGIPHVGLDEMDDEQPDLLHRVLTEYHQIRAAAGQADARNNPFDREQMMVCARDVEHALVQILGWEACVEQLQQEGNIIGLMRTLIQARTSGDFEDSDEFHDFVAGMAIREEQPEMDENQGSN